MRFFYFDHKCHVVVAANWQLKKQSHFLLKCIDFDLEEHGMGSKTSLEVNTGQVRLVFFKNSTFTSTEVLRFKTLLTMFLLKRVLLSGHQKHIYFLSPTLIIRSELNSGFRVISINKYIYIFSVRVLIYSWL